MRISYLILFITAAFFLLTSCASNNPPSTQIASNFIHRQDIHLTTKEIYPPKNPSQVAFYMNDKTPHAAYRIIGVATVSKYNLLGIQRETNTIHTMMKNLAASVGGDGLMDVNHYDDHVKANVIAFQRILI